MMRMSVRPARTASSTTYWIEGLSTTGSISLGWLFVAGRKRVPSPAAGITALRTGAVIATFSFGVPQPARNRSKVTGIGEVLDRKAPRVESARSGQLRPPEGAAEAEVDRSPSGDL